MEPGASPACFWGLELSMFVSPLSRAAASLSILQVPVGFGDPDHLVGSPATRFIRLEIGYELAKRIALAISNDDRGAHGFWLEECSLDLEYGEICIWGDTMRPSCDNQSWEVGGFEAQGSGYLQLMIELEHEGEDRLDGTMPAPSEPSIGQLMDCADQLKRLLALAAPRG
jgi:hypothetical protein